ncbi:MAG TPA: ABC transporter permease [Solirubrobacteraceae bacterium]|jgi:peptide/nickel transport system permease protein|nr:ABC transporter permease [Solirubrobacteraceae bacterium]
MTRFVIRRILAMLVVMIVISIVTFLLFEAIPNGNPAFRLAGRTATAAEIHQIEVKYGFDKPIFVQYARTMKNIFTGQAYSYTQGFNVLDEIRAGAPATLSLALGAGFIWLFISVVIGTVAAVRAGKYTDRVLTVLAMAGVSFPPFFLGAVLLYFLGYKAGIFPLEGYVKLTQNPVQWFMHLVLPWVTLSVLFIGFYSRVLRSNILDTANEDFVRAARAKGLSERQVLLRHILRNSLLPIISLWGLDLAQVIGGGAILTESVYNLHGIGQLAADSIGRLDIVPILVIVMLTAFAVVVLAAVIDILYAYLDPRIRLV